jgi:hypothetical protein
MVKRNGQTKRPNETAVMANERLVKRDAMPRKAQVTPVRKERFFAEKGVLFVSGLAWPGPVSSCLVLSRLVSSRLVLSCVAQPCRALIDDAYDTAMRNSREDILRYTSPPMIVPTSILGARFSLVLSCLVFSCLVLSRSLLLVVFCVRLHRHVPFHLRTQRFIIARCIILLLF